MTEPLGSAPASSFLDSLGARGLRRAEPRASIALAGAGCALAVLGALVIAGDTGASDGDFNRVPGIVLSALIVGAGLFTLSVVRQGPIATAGAVAAALGVPPFMFFVTFKMNDFPPYSTDGILMVSTLAWLAAYIVGPGRGRPFFLGAGLLGLWFTIMQLAEQVFDAPFGLFGFGMSASQSFSATGDSIGGGFQETPAPNFGPSEFDAFSAPDPTTLGLICIGLGLAYLVACRWLDGRGNHGTATPFALATLPTLFSGTLLLADDLEMAGTGLLLMAIGAGLALHGATVARRVTAWVGGGATALGAAVFLADMTDDPTVGGMLFMAAGIALVAVGHVVAAAMAEPDEMTVTTTLAAPVAVMAASPAAEPAAPADDDGDWAPPPPPGAPPPSI